MKQHAPLTPSLNNAPVIKTFLALPAALKPNESAVVSVVAEDSDNDKISYTWSASGGTITGNTTAVNWKAPAVDGVYTVIVSADDGRGGVVTQSTGITVETPIIPPPVNHDPVILGINADPYSVPAGTDSAITSVVTDEDGDTLTYTWSDDLLRTYPATPNVTFYGCCFGEHVVTLIVSDGKGGTATEGVLISVY